MVDSTGYPIDPRRRFWSEDKQQLFADAINALDEEKPWAWSPDLDWVHKRLQSGGMPNVGYEEVVEFFYRKWKLQQGAIAKEYYRQRHSTKAGVQLEELGGGAETSSSEEEDSSEEEGSSEEDTGDEW